MRIPLERRREIRDDSAMFSFLLHRRAFRGVIKIVPYNYRMNGVFNPFAVTRKRYNLGYNVRNKIYFIYNIYDIIINMIQEMFGPVQI